MRGKREALRSREGAARFGQNKSPVTGRLQGFLLSVLHQTVSGEGYLHQKVSGYVNLTSQYKHFIRIHCRFELIKIDVL